MLTKIKSTIQTHYLQLIRFGLVGIVAAIVHLTTVVFLVEHIALRPLIANIFGYLIAFNVSYFGHRYFTFQCNKPIMQTLVRFFILASVGFGLNETLFFLFLRYLSHYYPVALILTLTLTPCLTFLIGKLWIFHPAAQPQYQKSSR